MSDYRQYLKTLHRVPDDVILAVAGRPLTLSDGNSCLCGWFVREALARARNVDAATVKGESWGQPDGDDACATLYGGTKAEWSEIYEGVADEAENMVYDWASAGMKTVLNNNYRLPLIEHAFVERVLECVP